VKLKRIMFLILITTLLIGGLSSILLRVKGAQKFDSKLQLTDYKSFSGNIIDIVYGDLDGDNKQDKVVAYESSVVIYEDNDIVDEFKIGDSNFIDKDSNITNIEIGDTFDRNSIDDIDSIISAENSTTPEVTKITCRADSNNDLNETYFLINTLDTGYYVWIDVNNSGTPDPNVPGRTGIEITTIETDNDNETVASEIAAALQAVGGDGATFQTNVDQWNITVTNAEGGPANDTEDGVSATSFGFETLVQGIINTYTINPFVENLTHLMYADSPAVHSPPGPFYSLNYSAGLDGNFSVNIAINYGVTINSFDLNFRISDSVGGTIDYAWLKIYNNMDNQWESWVDLRTGIGATFQDFTNSSDELLHHVSEYFDSNNVVKLRFNYNHTIDVIVDFDYIDLTALVTDSANDLIVGGGDGRICFIQISNASIDEYKIASKLESADYGGTGVQITDLIKVDINNNDKDEIIVSTYSRYTYVIKSDKNDDQDYIQMQRLDAGAGNMMTSLAANDPATNSSDFLLCLGSRNGFYYTTTYDDIAPYTFNTPLVGKDVGSPINDVAISDVWSGSAMEVITASINGKLMVYDFSTATEKWDSGDLIAKGNEIISITTGDFGEKGTNQIAIASSQETLKIQVLEENDGDFEVYWDSSVYLREKIIALYTDEQSGEDNLIIASLRHTLSLSTDFPDKDKDSLSDLSERLFYKTDPKNPDSDSDGLEDGVEIFIHGTDPLNADTDGDLIPDGWEVAMGTDPLDPLSSILLFILIPTLFAVAVLSVVYVARKSSKQKKEEYRKIKSTPNLMPQVRRLILQRLESFSKEFKGFETKSEMAKFKRNLSTEMMAIVLDRMYNFLEYLRLKGVLFTDREELVLKKIVNETIEPIQNKTNTLIKNLLMYETKYKQFNEQFLKLLAEYAGWKQAAKRGTKIVEELIKCPKCETLQPKGSAFCLECGEKLVK